MIRVQVLTEEGSQSSIAFNFPLRLHRRLLRESGLEVSLVLTPPLDPAALECDVLFVNSNVFGSVWPGLNENVQRLLEKARARAGKIVWFDTSASSGTAQFDVIPLVDLYCKAQVLADRSGYLRDHHGDRVFTDFYHQRDGVRDEDENGGGAIRVMPRPEDLAKIRLSWSTALGDFGTRARRYRRFGRYVPAFRRYSACFVPPERQRRVDVACRIGLGHRRATVLHHRNQIKRILETDLGLDTRPVPREDYLVELSNARVGVSPFGYGEVCFRDFEVILAGAALLKPDMSHLQTWPPLYENGVTYMAHQWDLGDLKERLGDLLAAGRWREISRNAQHVYRRLLFEREGHEEFCGRVAEIVRACA